MDLIVFKQMNSLAGFNPLVDGGLIFLAGDLAYVLLIFLGVALIWPRIFDLNNRLSIFLAVSVAFFSRFVVKEIIVLFYDRPRPFEVVENVNWLVYHDVLGSFPSGHAIFFFTLATLILFYSKRLGGLLLAGSVLMVLARVAVGLHWPTDILAGAGIGVLIAVTAYYLFEKHLRRYVSP